MVRGEGETDVPIRPPSTPPTLTEEIPQTTGMKVIKRDGTSQPVLFDKITGRIKKLCYGLDESHVDPASVAHQVIRGVFDGVETSRLDELAADTAAVMITTHPDYSKLAARISVSNLHKKTEKTFSVLVSKLSAYVTKQGRPAPLISEEVARIVAEHSERLDGAIVYDRDFEYDYFGFRTLERSYLLKMDGVVVERPQHMLMRVSVGIHKGDIDRVIETYELMSKRYFTHATPTMFNSGTPKPQMSSCFLLMEKDDSIDGIFDTLKQCAKISQFSGGIGLSVTNIRAKGSYIRGSGGESNGLVPMLRVYDNTARYVDQGGGKRKGGFAMYLEPWHADVMDFLELKKNIGKEEARARDLFYALWIPDLFMKRIENDESWSLFCPNECPGLCDTFGEEFEANYVKYENEGRAKRTVRAQEVWFAILDSQIETGTPYMLYKDSANRKSNHKHLGTIRSSNLCTEIIQYTSPDEVAVCNLASISLPAFVHGDAFDFEALQNITMVVTRNLNSVIDHNFYPIEEARTSNMRHRPIGIGVQGLADAFILLGYEFDSSEAADLNRTIFETMYYGALRASCDLAKNLGTYETYDGSPVSQGLLQFDMWEGETPLCGKWDWAALRADINKYGLRNSLLLAPMPTASTAQIFGNCEAFEPYTSNVFTRRVLAGEFPVVNKHLIKALIDDGLWNKAVMDDIMRAGGSIQHIQEIPDKTKRLFRTAWEMKQKVILDMAADRARFICQSQSMNVWMSDPTYSRLSSMHFYGWKKGLKTGMYYLRTRAAADALQFTVPSAPQTSVPQSASSECSLVDREGCVSCGA